MLHLALKHSVSWHSDDWHYVAFGAVGLAFGTVGICCIGTVGIGWYYVS